jgi:hypothetical protein
MLLFKFYAQIENMGLPDPSFIRRQAWIGDRDDDQKKSYKGRACRADTDESMWSGHGRRSKQGEITRSKGMSKRESKGDGQDKKLEEEDM